MLADRGELALHVHGGLGVKGEHVRSGVRVLGDVLLGALHHEVDVQRPVGQPAERPDERSAERQVRDEVPVHDVHVDPLGAALNRLGDLLPEASQIGAEHARRDARAHD